MDCSSDYGTPLYSYHPYKKISANRSTERITGRGSKVFQTQQTKEVMPLTNLLFGKEFNRVVEDGCARCTLLIAEILSGKNARAWVSMDFT